MLCTCAEVFDKFMGVSELPCSYALGPEMAEGPSPSSLPSASHAGTCVQEKTLPKLRSLLSPVVHNWELFAQQLGVPSSQISQIRASNPTTGPSYLYTCFSQTLEWWVTNDENPTYEAIIAILDPKRGQITPLMNRTLASQVKKFMAKEQQTVKSPTAASAILMDKKRELNVEVPKPAQNKEINSGGYDCEPVGKPTKDLKLESICNKCSLVLHEPHLTSCCGYHFCRSCIEPIKEDGKSCPFCATATFEVMHDKGLDRSLKEVKRHEPVGMLTKELQTICCICLLVLREPHLVSCCGYHFCQSCIRRIKEDRKSCPICAASFEVMYDKGLEQSLKEVNVNCNKTDCHWTGRLDLFSDHLRQDCPKEAVAATSPPLTVPMESKEKVPDVIEMTAEDICHGVPREKLDSPISDIHIADLAFMLTTWEELAPYLGLTEAEEAAIQVDYQGRYGLQKRQALRKWKSKFGRSPKGATYRQLIIALCHARQKEIVEKVKELLMTTSDTLETFRKYLVDCYTITQHPSRMQWLFPQLSSYIDLTLVQATDTQIPQSGQGESRAKPEPLKEVQLGELFHVGSHQAERKVVLIEGPAGCGKTTLSWHVCREWAAGRLFQEFSLLIHISLEDLRAKCLADIIPHESSGMREAVAGAIFEQGGNGVCFLFDAWDEAPRDLQGRSSYLFKFITGISRKKLDHCSIIVTSQPVAAGLLYPHLTARVNIRGFGATKLETFICASLEDPNARWKLLQQLREKPQVKDLCTLPINAAIVVHLFRSSHSTLPLTRTGVFKKLLYHLLLRHMQLRTVHGIEQCEKEEFECLPGNLLQEFRSVCGLAFHGIMTNKNVFNLSSLRQLGLTHPSSPLGLMRAQQHLTDFGPHYRYSFIYFAVQEFLAAYHISKLSEKEQTKVIRQILHSTPLSTVLPFYAGLTGLFNEGACGILLEVTKHPLDKIAVQLSLQHTLHESCDRRRLLLALLNCIYEAQRPSICKLVSRPLHPSCIVSIQEHGYDPGNMCVISFTYLGLDAIDCLSIGYFIHTKCVVSKNLLRVAVDLGNCCIGDTEIEILIKHIRQIPSSGPGVALDLHENTMSHKVIKSISDSLIQSSVIQALSLNGCLHPAIADIKCALKYLIEGVSRNSSLECLAIADCSLGPAHAYHLVLLAAVCNTKQIVLSVNNIRSAIPFIAEAIKHNRAIRVLQLGACHISDRELLVLGMALQQNDTLTYLDIGLNPFSSNALTLFLKGLIGTNSRLRTVVVFHSLSDEQRSIIKFINTLRFNQSAPPLQATGMASTDLITNEAAHALHSAPPDIRTRSICRDSNKPIAATGGIQSISLSQVTNSEAKQSTSQEFDVNLVSRQHLLASGTGGHTFDYMEECGYILTVPDNYSASSVVEVDCCLINNYNNFQFPDDCDTAMTSALYCINTSHNLNNPVTFRVQHCALVQESSELDHICFITADSTSGPPYQFSYIDHDYEIYREYGEVTLSHFCWLATVWRKIRGRPRINYCGLLYQTKRTITSQMFHFILIKNLATCIRAVDQQFSALKDARKVNEMIVAFSDNSAAITLDIPEDGHCTPEGWHIAPMVYPPVIQKNDAKYYASYPETVIPACQLMVMYQGAGNIPPLNHRIALLGARTPNCFLISLNSAGSVPSSESATAAAIPAVVTKPTAAVFAARPTLQQLNRLKYIDASGEKKDIRVLTAAASKWWDLGVALGYGPDVLNIIKDSEQMNPKCCLQQLITTWFQSGKKDSWEAFLEALEDAELERLAEDIRKALPTMITD